MGAAARRRVRTEPRSRLGQAAPAECAVETDSGPVENEDCSSGGGADRSYRDCCERTRLPTRARDFARMFGAVERLSYMELLQRRGAARSHARMDRSTEPVIGSRFRAALRLAMTARDSS